MDANDANVKSNKVYKIKNPQIVASYILFGLLFLFLSVALALLSFSLIFKEGAIFGLVFAMLIALIIFISYYSFYCIKAELPGIVIDVENDKFSFPGGGVSAKSFTEEFLSPKFLLQRTRRFEYRLSDVTSISPKMELTTSKDGHISRSYYLCVAGTFGSADIKVGDERKLQELRSVFVNELNMGVPVLNR